MMNHQNSNKSRTSRTHDSASEHQAIGSHRVSTFRHGLLVVLLGAIMLPLASADKLTYRDRNGQQLTIEGNVLGFDSQNTVRFERRDGCLVDVLEKDQIKLEDTEEEVKLYDKKELRAALEEEFGAEFKVLPTNNYILMYNSTPQFAREAGKLFERAFAVFHNYFKQQGSFKLSKPAQPLVAIVCASREEYLKQVTALLGKGAEGTAGVYDPKSNRMYMYNSFGGEMERKLQDFAAVNPRQAESAVMLLREQNISTVVHECIHQIAFNSGFHNRSCNMPYWLVEGMAMFFESPQFDAKGGWGGVGTLNQRRYESCKVIAPKVTDDFMIRLVTEDGMFQSSATAEAAYAQAWAVTYFLAKSKKKEYMNYIRMVNNRKPLQAYDAKQRLDHFREAFGKGPDEMRAEMSRFYNKVALNQVK